VCRRNGEKKQKGTDSIQQNSSSVQGRQQYFQRSNNIESEWSLDRYSNPTGCSLLLVHDQSKLPKGEKKKENSQKISKSSGVDFSAPKSNMSMDINDGTRSQNATTYSQRFLEIKPEKYYQPCIWCINYSSQLEQQGTIVQNPTKERQIPSSLGSIWGCDAKIGKVGVRELLGNECLDLFMPVETRSPNQVSNYNSTQQRNKGPMQKLPSYSKLVDKLKNDHKFREFCGSTDKSLIYQENREFFSKICGITSIHPLLVNHSRTVLLFLDDRGIMFMWSEMEYGMRILGINKLEGLANYLYHPDKICVVMEDTGELVPEVELTRRVMEKMKLEVKELAEKNREKRLAKKKRLAEEKRLKRLAEK
jgi:hypothetical protein